MEMVLETTGLTKSYGNLVAAGGVGLAVPTQGSVSVLARYLVLLTVMCVAPPTRRRT